MRLTPLRLYLLMKAPKRCGAPETHEAASPGGPCSMFSCKMRGLLCVGCNVYTDCSPTQYCMAKRLCHIQQQDLARLLLCSMALVIG